MTLEIRTKRALPTAKSVGYQVRIAHRALDRLLNAELATKGLKAGYWYYLRALWHHDGLTQRELSNALNVMETTTVTMISGMQEAGLITRERDPHDKRKMNIFLTEHARKLEKKLMPIAKHINELATEGVSEKDLRVTLRVLSIINGNLDNAMN